MGSRKPLSTERKTAFTPIKTNRKAGRDLLRQMEKIIYDVDTNAKKKKDYPILLFNE